jgi:F-type H+-transporting ATPase subunit b
VLIDWFTVIAQIVNFLILVGLLKYFLFDRITKAMDERERTISSTIEKADESMKKAQAEAERYGLMNEEMEERRQRIIGAARDEAESLRRELSELARAEVRGNKAAWEESLEREREAFLVDFRKLVAEQAVSIARAALSDLASDDLEQRIVYAFLERFRDLPEQDLGEIRDVLRTSDPQLTVQTAFELSDEHRDQILKALHSRLDQRCQVRWSTAGSVICGLELKLRGHKLAWSVDSYLDGLEKKVAATVEERIHQIVDKPSAAEKEDSVQERKSKNTGTKHPDAFPGKAFEESRGIK